MGQVKERMINNIPFDQALPGEVYDIDSLDFEYSRRYYWR